MAILIVIIILLIVLLGYGYNAQQKHNLASANIYKLWTDHLMYTRLVVTSIIDGPRNDWKSTGVINKNIYISRLMQNQSDIASLFGADMSIVQSLLQEHITSAGAVTTDISKGADATADMATLYSNATAIGTYLNKKLNSTTMVGHMKAHVDTLVTMITNYANKVDDTAATDSYIVATNAMAFDMCKLV